MSIGSPTVSRESAGDERMDSSLPIYDVYVSLTRLIKERPRVCAM